MHEPYVIKDLINTVENVAAREKGWHVQEVELSIGCFSGANPNALFEDFRRSCRGTVCEGARVIVKKSSDTRISWADEIMIQAVTVQGPPAPVHRHLE